MTEQIIYSELEAYAVRWPYLKLEPIDAKITYSEAKSFNVSGGTSRTLGGTSVQKRIYTNASIGQTIKLDNERLDSLNIYISKTGSPSDLKIRYYETKPITVGVVKTDHEQTSCTGASPAWKILGNEYVAYTETPSSNIRLRRFSLLSIARYKSGGIPPVPIVELRQGLSGTVLATASEVVFEITNSQSTQDAGHIHATFDPPVQLTGGTTYAIIFKPTGQETSNSYYGANATCSGGSSSHGFYRTTDNGRTWSFINSFLHRLHIWEEHQGGLPDKLLHETTVKSQDIPSTANWVDILRGKRIFVENNIAIMLEAEGDGVNNYYTVYRIGSDVDGYSHGFEKTNGVWQAYPEDYYITFNSTKFAKLYEGYYTYPNWRAASPTGEAEVEIKANSGTVYVVLVVGGLCGSEQSLTNTTLAKKSLPAEVKVASGGQHRYMIIARGNGATGDADGDGVIAWFRPAVLYDKNPVFPRDFFFSEMYLLRVRAEQANTVVRLNDMTSIYLANAGDTFAVGEAFRTPVKKLQILSGQATCDMLGVI